jgi:hypothetical protein
MILEMIIAELIRKSSKFRTEARSIGQEEPGCQVRDRAFPEESGADESSAGR